MFNRSLEAIRTLLLIGNRLHTTICMLWVIAGVDDSYPGVNSASIVILIVASLWIVFILVFVISFIISMARVLLTKSTSSDEE